MEQGLQHGLPGAVLGALSHRHGQQEPPGSGGLDLELLESLRVLLKEPPYGGLRLRLKPPTEKIPVFRETLAAVHADELRAVQALKYLHEALDPSRHALSGQDADIGGGEVKIGPLTTSGPDGMFPDLLDPQEVPGGTTPEEAHCLPPGVLLSRQRYAWGTRNRNAAHRRQKSSTLYPSTWMARKAYTTVQMAGAVQLHAEQGKGGEQSAHRQDADVTQRPQPQRRLGCQVVWVDIQTLIPPNRNEAPQTRGASFPTLTA